MTWSEQIDGYCERLAPGLWAEPVNLVTNVAFVLVAIWAYRRAGHTVGARVLAVILGVIGVGSALFHSFATPWAALADTAPIVGFVLVYIYLANREFWGLPRLWAIVATLGFFPYAAVVIALLSPLGWLADSVAYAPVPILIAAYGIALRARAPATARGLLIGAALLVLSLTARTVDMPLCASLPLGTHFLWHLLNAVMLGHMIELYRRHMRPDAIPLAS